jgi:hypothetical protein
MRLGTPFRIVLSADAATAAALERPHVVERARLTILVAWVGSRALVFLCAVITQLSGFPRAGWQPGLRRHPFAALVMWDAHWYREIAGNGYLLITGHHSGPAFFPLMSVLMQAPHALGLSFRLSSLLLANLGMLAGVFALYELARLLLPEADARRAAVYAALFPYSFIFSMGYPEGLALATIAWAGVLALRGRWAGCALLAAASALLRPEGVFVVIPVAALAWQRARRGPWPERSLAATAVLAAPAAVVSFSLYLWHVTGDVFAWSRAEHTWGRQFRIDGVAHAFAQLVTGGSSGWFWRDAAFAAVYVVAICVAARGGVPVAWIAAGAAICLLPLTSGSFESSARYGVLALPVYFGLAVLGRQLWFDRTMRFVAPAVLVAMSFTIVLNAP